MQQWYQLAGMHSQRFAINQPSHSPTILVQPPKLYTKLWPKKRWVKTSKPGRVKDNATWVYIYRIYYRQTVIFLKKKGGIENFTCITRNDSQKNAKKNIRLNDCVLIFQKVRILVFPSFAFPSNQLGGPNSGLVASGVCPVEGIGLLCWIEGRKAFCPCLVPISAHRCIECFFPPHFNSLYGQISEGSRGL